MTAPTITPFERQRFLLRLLGPEALAELTAPLSDEDAARIDAFLTSLEAGMPVTALADRALNADGTVADEQAFEQLRAAIR